MKIVSVWYINGEQDGYRRTTETAAPHRVIKEVVEKNEPVFIKSIEDADMYLTCEVERYQPNGNCMLKSSKEDACYFTKWTHGNLDELEVYKKVHDTTPAKLKNIRSMITDQVVLPQQKVAQTCEEMSSIICDRQQLLVQSQV